MTIQLKELKSKFLRSKNEAKDEGGALIAKLLKEKKISIGQLKDLLTTINDPWEEAKGILKNKKIDSLKYQKKIRREWERNN